MTGSWQVENARWLQLRLRRLRLQLHRRAAWLHRTAEDRVVDWLLPLDDPEEERTFFVGDSQVQTIDAEIARLDAALSDCEDSMRRTTAPPALVTLTECVELSPFERELLLLSAGPAFDGGFARACAELHADSRRPYASLQLALALFVPDPVDRLLAAEALSYGRPLRFLRLIDVSEDPDEPLTMRRLGVDDRIANYLRGLNQIDERLDGNLSVVSVALTSARLEALAARVAEAVRQDTARWTTVNLVGSVEGGAREVAALACASLHLSLHAIDITRFAGGTPAERATVLSLLGREAVLGRTAFLVNGAEVERISAEARAIDELIDRVGAVLFVVSADRWPGDRAARVFRVARPSRAEQRGLWKTALAPVVNSVNGEVDAIVQQFDFGPPAIAAAVARAEREGNGSICGSTLWATCRDQYGLSLDRLARRVIPEYGWADIVVSDEIRGQLRALASQVEQRSRVYESWGFGAQLARGRGITALFSGPSGTGKTMAAEVLAGHLALDLYRIDLAEMVSKYIGETEKNLRHVFDAAERSGVILFFDEADALFGNRTEVRDSHDRYANLEVNYLLQRMEDYSGLAILATNRRAALDGAFLRRIRFIVDFPLPGADDRRRMWERVFPADAAVEGLELSLLAGLNLSGGNIRSIAVNAAFLAAAEATPIGMTHVVHAAAREYVKLSKPISASEFGAYYEMARQ